MPTTTVHLVRHGEVDNPHHVLYGRLPGFDLSIRGRRQAARLADYFATGIAAVRTSPLERAVQTAAPIATRHGLTPVVDERLIEAANLFQGVSGSLAWWLMRHPDQLWALRNWREPSWGEPTELLIKRMRAAIDDVRHAFPGSEVVLVSHQAPIWGVRRAYERAPTPAPPWHRQCALASVTSIRFGDHAVLGVEYAEPAKAVMTRGG